MPSKPLNMQCPYCGQYKVEQITEIDPMSFNYHEITKTVCMFCGKVIEPVAKTTYSSSTDTDCAKATSNDKYCQNCNTKMEPFGYDGWYTCPKCGYGYVDYIGDLPKELSDNEIELSKKLCDEKFILPCNNTWGVGKIATAENMSSQTLTITNCEKIKLEHKEMDIDFEFDTSKLENVDTIIINGYRYIKDKVG